MTANLDIGAFVPAQYEQYRTLLADGLRQFVRELSPRRQTEILDIQQALRETATAPARLVEVLRCSPALHKLGQVLARRKELEPELRFQLQRLETIAPLAPVSAVLSQVRDSLAHAVGHFEMKFSDTALAEGSVAVIVPFTFRNSEDSERTEGVLKILKAGIEDRVGEDIGALRGVEQFLQAYSDRYALPIDAMCDAIDDVVEILQSEINPVGEQRHLARAAACVQERSEVVLPRLLPMSTARVTAMTRLRGQKLTDTAADETARHGIAERAVRELLVAPFFSAAESAIFHGDPHAGNLLAIENDRLGVIDWALSGQLTRGPREQLAQIMVGGASGDARRICRAVEALGKGGVGEEALRQMVEQSLAGLRLRLPNLSWAIRLLDDAAHLGARFDHDLMLFRKTHFTLEGVASDIHERFEMDQTFAKEAIARLMSDWPDRFLAPAHSRSDNTHLSTNDLLDVIASIPVRSLRWWIARSNN